MEMEKNLEMKNQELTNEDAKEIIDILQNAIVAMFHHVNYEEALKEFRSRTGTEEDKDLDEAFDELYNTYVNEEHYVDKALGVFEKFGIHFEDLEGLCEEEPVEAN